VLLDYLDVVIHVQHAEERVYYALERLWKDCPRLALPEPVGVAPSAPGAGGAPDPDLGEIQ
jgi:ribosome-associated protein